MQICFSFPNLLITHIHECYKQFQFIIRTSLHIDEKPKFHSILKYVVINEKDTLGCSLYVNIKIRR